MGMGHLNEVDLERFCHGTLDPDEGRSADT
jgi:hypothetical protein